VQDRVVPIYPAGQPSPNVDTALATNSSATQQSTNVNFVTGPGENQGVVAGDPTSTSNLSRDPTIIPKAETDAFIAWQGNQINPVTGKPISETWAAQGISNPYEDPRIQKQAVEQIQRAGRRADLFQSQGAATPEFLLSGGVAANPSN